MRKYKKMLSSNLTEYFFYFIVLSVLVTFTLGWMMYYYSSAILRQEAIENNNNTLLMLKNAQELVLTQVDKAMENIFLETQYHNYMDYVKAQDITRQISLRERLDYVITLNDYIHSVYIYYYQDQYILASGQGPVPLENFNDRQFAEQLPIDSADKKFVKTRSIQGIAPNQSQTVISISRPIPLFFKGKPVAYVVVNIKGVYLQQVIDSIKTNENSSVAVADEAGHIITQKAGAIIDSGFTKMITPYIGGSGANQAGFVVDKVNGIDTLVSYLTSDKYGWIYIYSMPMSIVTYSTGLLGKTSMILCLIELVLGFLGSLFFSNRIFVPVKRMMDTNDSLKLMLKDYEIYSRNALLINLLNGKEEVNEKLLERLDYYGLLLDKAGYFLICLITMDDYTKFTDNNPEQTRNAFVHQITKLVSSAAFDNGDCTGFVVETNTNEISLVLNFATEYDACSSASTKGYGLAKLIYEALAVGEPHTFTVGVSTVYRGIDYLRHAYYEAGSALDNKLTLGSNQVIFYEKLETTERYIPYPLAIEKKICNSLKQGDREGLQLYLMEFQAYIYNNSPDSTDAVRLFFLQLFTASLKNMSEMDTYPNLVSDMNHTSYSDLLEQETVDGMIKYMGNLYEQMIVYVENKRNQIYKELMNEIVIYIRLNLSLDLKLERLAEQFYISLSYLRKVFKDEYGITIKEFISNERMAEAKRLLENSDNRISQIAEQVGYLSVNSFSKAFKMETGNTPGEYRTRLLLKKDL